MCESTLRFKDFWGTVGYSVGDPPATHVRGLGLGPKYSFCMASPALLATGWPISSQKKVFFRGSKRVFLAHFHPLSPIFAHFSTKTAFSSQKTSFLTPKKHVFFLNEIGHPVAKSAGEDIQKLYFGPRPSPRT